VPIARLAAAHSALKHKPVKDVLVKAKASKRNVVKRLSPSKAKSLAKRKS
jgi:hypothetical protein